MIFLYQTPQPVVSFIKKIKRQSNLDASRKDGPKISVAIAINIFFSMCWSTHNYYKQNQKDPKLTENFNLLKFFPLFPPFFLVKVAFGYNWKIS
jgi:hypothetical protein